MNYFRSITSPLVSQQPQELSSSVDLLTTDNTVGTKRVVYWGLSVFKSCLLFRDLLSKSLLYFFKCNGFRWPLFFYLHQQFTVLINYLCILDTTLRILDTQWNYMLFDFMIFMVFLALLLIFKVVSLIQRTQSC